MNASLPFPHVPLACRPSVWLAALILLSAALRATDYHVDAQRGDDANSGTRARKAWRSLEKASAAPLAPGDRLLLRAGGVWRGQLRVTARGTEKQPILVQAYGKGPRPRIEAGGLHEDALLVRNAQYLSVSDLELTNDGPGEQPRRGAHVVADNCGELRGLVLSDLYIHEVRGTQKKKDNGGIIFRTLGEQTPSRFIGLRLERNIIWRVDRSGIAAQSYHHARTRWFPSLNVVIRDNWVGDVGGDGIVPWATDGALIEHNIVQGANERAGSYNAGIWPWATDNSVFRLNRASGVKTLMDGQGFDSDYNSRNTLLEYNLSHDNEGGFLLVCTPGKRKPEENVGNVGTIARCNISRNDGARTFHVSAAERTTLERNAVYVGAGHDVQVLLLTDWTGWANGLTVRDNLFHIDGAAHYGHEVERGKDGSYRIGPGWGPTTNVVLAGNRYSGRDPTRPAEDTQPSAAAPRPITFDWPGPQFNPTQPDSFPAYLRAHRKWMLRLMREQFGERPSSLK